MRKFAWKVIDLCMIPAVLAFQVFILYMCGWRPAVAILWIMFSWLFPWAILYVHFYYKEVRDRNERE